MTDFDFTNRYNMSDVKYVCKNDPDNIISVLYYNGKNKTYYVKRFLVETNLLNKRFGFISAYTIPIPDFLSFNIFPSGEMIVEWPNVSLFLVFFPVWLGAKI